MSTNYFYTLSYTTLFRSWHLVAGIGEAMAQAMVVGEDQEPGGVLVEAAHGEDPPVEVVEELVYGQPPAGVGPSGDVPDGLVERDRHALGFVPRADAVHRDGVPPRIDAARGDADHLPTNGHPAVLDPPLRLAARADAEL